MKLFHIFKTELLLIISRPTGWLAACAIFILSGLVFQQSAISILNQGKAINAAGDIIFDLNTVNTIFLIFIIPIFSMKLISSDILEGRMRLYLLTPVSRFSIVFGKFLAVVAYFFGVTALSLIYPFYISLFSEVHLLSLFTGIAGLMLYICLLTSFSFFVSAVAKNNIVSYLVSSLTFFGFTIYTSSSQAPAWMVERLHFVGFVNPFVTGNVQVYSIVLFLILSFSFLYLTYNSLKLSKWEA